MVKVSQLDIPGAKLITINRYKDNRGFLNESWRDAWNDELEISPRINFVQDMWSYTEEPDTIRGLHSLCASAAQWKLVSVLRGEIFDVIADARVDSPTFGKYVPFNLSEFSPAMLLIPPGCFHGYLTKSAHAVVHYKVDKYHSPELDIGLNWQDPTFNIKWPLQGKSPIISDKDQQLPFL